MATTLKSLRLLSQNLCVLYVEDDTILREQTQKVFQNLFKHVDIAANGRDSLSQYKQYYNSTGKYYDILISDIQMPFLDGIELTRIIFTINAKQKVIIISAYDDKKYLIDLIELGVDGFMEKPISSEKILPVLYKICDSCEGSDIIAIEGDFSYKFSTATLFQNNIKVALTENESKLLSLLICNTNQYFDYIDIFNHLYFDDAEKEFSRDSIKSLVKRLRKKLPQNLISNTQNIGYKITL